MKILVCFLLHAVIAFADAIEGHSSQLESKILNGCPPENPNDQLFIASLQINRTHMCGAGMFQLGFLLSAGTCVIDIKNERANADVAMGSYDLDKGERLRILDLEIYRLFFGIIRFQVTERVKDISNTITFPLLTKNPFRLSDNGNDAMLCGWGPAAEREIHSNSLHCVIIQIQSWRACASFNYRRGLDYQHRYHCGYVGHEKKLTLEDQGNLVTKKYPEYRDDQIHIIGIAVGEFEFQGSYYARFIKSSVIFERIQKMLRKLNATVSANRSDSYIDSSSSNNNTAHTEEYGNSGFISRYLSMGNYLISIFNCNI